MKPVLLSIFYKVVRLSLVLILLYIDDLIITCNYNAKISKAKKQLQDQYEMKVLGDITKYLDVEFSHSDKGLIRHQHTYAQQLLDDQGMQDFWIEHTPLCDGRFCDSVCHEYSTC